MIEISFPAPGVKNLTLSDSARMNPVGFDLVDELESSIADPAVAVIVLSAAGGPVFSAGGDLSLSPDRLAVLSRRLYELYRTVTSSATVLVVAANGLSVGAGAQLVLCSDLRFVGPGFRFRASIPKNGLAGGMWVLPGEIGRGRALELLLTGRELDAAEAHSWGLVSAVVDNAQLEAAAIAAELALLPEAFRLRVKRATALGSISIAALSDEQESFVPPNADEKRGDGGGLPNR